MKTLLPPLERRLQNRYWEIVQSHVKSANSLAAGPAIPPGEETAHATTQGCWRFLNNETVSLPALVEPLRELARTSAARSNSPFVLVVHDWSKLDFKSHSSKRDLLEITHDEDVGYDLTTSLMIDAANGQTLAPVQMHMKTANKIYSTAAMPPRWEDHHLEQLLPTMDEIGSWNFARRPVHIIDREADSLGHFRQWIQKGHLFLVRADDRRVLWNGKSYLLSEIVSDLSSQGKFTKAREVSYKGKPAIQYVAETAVVLHKPHKTRINGKQREVPGAPIGLRLIVSQIRDENGTLLAEWMLLTNVSAADAPTAEIALWYYWRWRIESFFKLLKSHGLQIEHWRQKTGFAVARRLLVGAMACSVISSLQEDQSRAAQRFRKLLVRLSGRMMKHGVESTAPSLLAGYFVYLTMVEYLSASGDTLEDIIELGRAAGVPFFETD